jgi:hypothetical protein
MMMHEQGFPLLWSKQLGGTGQYSWEVVSAEYELQRFARYSWLRQ